MPRRFSSRTGASKRINVSFPEFETEMFSIFGGLGVVLLVLSAAVSVDEVVGMVVVVVVVVELMADVEVGVVEVLPVLLRLLAVLIILSGLRLSGTLI